MSEEEKKGKPCPCKCGGFTKDGRYLKGHKPGGGALKRTATARKGFLLVEADAEICDRIWQKLGLEQKIAALNSLRN